MRERSRVAGESRYEEYESIATDVVGSIRQSVTVEGCLGTVQLSRWLRHEGGGLFG